ncbi:Ig lambda chain C region [Lepisosteus oculatus]|uniref:Ig lambda chain C region n=1 Tax=Lepisosteus oculatus TaxID=7918 RepID=UPI003715C6B4
MRMLIAASCFLAIWMRFVIGDKVEGYIIFSEGIQLIVRGPQTSAADPSVTVFPPPQDQLRSSGRATLVCLIRGLSTSMADVSWYSNGELVTKGVIVSPASRDSDGTFSTVSLLAIPALSWEQGHTYSCTATDGDKVAESSVQASRC